MTCRQIEDENLIGRYLAGTFPTRERKTFEEHYFACDRCFEALESARAARAALMASGPAVVQRRSLTTAMWRIPIGVAAAIVVAIVALKVGRRPDQTVRAPAVSQPARNADLEPLARIDPPVFSAP